MRQSCPLCKKVYTFYSYIDVFNKLYIHIYIYKKKKKHLEKDTAVTKKKRKGTQLVFEKTNWLQITCWPVVLVGHYQVASSPDTVQKNSNEHKKCPEVQVLDILSQYTDSYHLHRLIQTRPRLRSPTVVPSLKAEAALRSALFKGSKSNSHGFYPGLVCRGAPHSVRPSSQAAPKSQIAGFLHCN